MVSISRTSTRALLVLPFFGLLSAACGSGAFTSGDLSADSGTASGGAAGAGGAPGAGGSSEAGGAGASSGSRGGGDSGAAGVASSDGTSASAGASGAAGASGSADAARTDAGRTDASSFADAADSASRSDADSGGNDVLDGGSDADAHLALDSADADAGRYTGPTVGTAKQFAALAYSAVTTANISAVVGSIGVSAMAVSVITGFDNPADVKYGTDSLVPNDQLTIIAQRDVTSLVLNIDPRACDVDLTNVPGGLTGDITLHPGVTCMLSFANDVRLNGHVTLDAQGDPNAFFVIKGNNTLTVENGAQVVLTNGAQACSVFWRIAKAITVGTTAQLYGTFITGSAVTMNTHATLNGRLLAQTEGVHLDANTIVIPSDGAPSGCSHIQ